MQNPIWYYTENGQSKGPLTDDEMRQLMSTGVLNQSSMVWKEGMPGWISVAQLSQSSNRPTNDNIPARTEAPANNSVPQAEPEPIHEQTPTENPVANPISDAPRINVYNPELAHLGTQNTQESPSVNALADNRTTNLPESAHSHIQWFYASNGESVGPISTDGLQNKLETRDLGPETMVWNANMTSWTPASQVLELKQVFETKRDFPGSRESQGEDFSSSPSVMRKSRFSSQDEGNTGSYTPRSSVPEPTNQQNLVRPGAPCFYVIAVFSALGAVMLASSISRLSGTESAVGFIFLIMSIVLTLVFTIIGAFAKKVRWVYITGIVLYSIDALRVLLAFDFIAILMHALFLIGLIQGFKQVPERVKIAKNKSRNTR